MTSRMGLAAVLLDQENCLNFSGAALRRLLPRMPKITMRPSRAGAGSQHVRAGKHALSAHRTQRHTVPAAAKMRKICVLGNQR